MSRLRPSREDLAVRNIGLELLEGWDCRRAEYRALAYRYAGTEEARVYEAKAAELDEVMEELGLFFPKSKEMFER